MLCKYWSISISFVFNRCLNSLYNQTNKNFEIIFVDDSSTDNSIQIAKEFLNKNNIKKFRLLINKKKTKYGSYNQINCILAALKFCKGEIISFAKATLVVDKNSILCEGEGNGPVHALDNAIRNNIDKLAKYSDYLKDLKLVDYKVRILNTGTEATTRVSIESTDSKGKNWFTIGVSPNIIDASFKALVDSLDYKLFKDNAPAST